LICGFEEFTTSCVHPNDEAAAVKQLKTSAFVKSASKQGIYPEGPVQGPTSELKYTEELKRLLDWSIALLKVAVA
jgi:hypothetical protein